MLRIFIPYSVRWLPPLRINSDSGTQYAKSGGGIVGEETGIRKTMVVD